MTDYTDIYIILLGWAIAIVVFYLIMSVYFVIDDYIFKRNLKKEFKIKKRSICLTHLSKGFELDCEITQPHDETI